MKRIIIKQSFLVLSSLWLFFAGCGSDIHVPVVNPSKETQSFEPKIEWISGRKTSDDDEISSVAKLDGETMLASQISYGNILSFDRVSKTWKILNTYKTNNWALNSIFFFDRLRGFIVGNYGTIIKTNDGGKSWEQLPRFSDLNLEQIMFLDKLNGYIIAGMRVVDKKTERLNFTYCVYSTRDGGNTWDEYFKSDGEQIFDMAVFSVKTSVISIAGRYLVRTDDGGRSWARVKTNMKDANSIATDSNKNGWLVNWKGEFLTSSDHGTSWKSPENLPIEFFTKEWEDISFDNLGNGVAISKDGTIAYTKNNGTDWRLVPQKVGIHLRSVVIKDGMGTILSEHEIYSISFINFS